MGVSNPSRGRCAFGQPGLTASGGNCTSVSNPSRGRCAFGRVKAAHALGSNACLKPLSGKVCLRPLMICPRWQIRSMGLKPLSGKVCLRPCYRHRGSGDGNVSNPSRGRCAFGLTGRTLPCLAGLSLKPLSGKVCLRPLKGPGPNTGLGPCLKPLSGKVCLRPSFGTTSSRTSTTSQTPLGEGVPSA